MFETSALQVEEIACLEDLEGLRDAWTRLCDRSPRATPFQRPEWLIPWWRAFQPGEPWVLTVRRGDRLVALAPFLLYRNEGRRTVAFCGGGVSDYCDVVTDPDGEDEAISALLAHLAAHRGLWETGDFEPVPGDSPLLRVDPPDGLAAWTEPRDVCPFLPLPDRVEALGEVVHTRQLANLRKYRRKAGALGDLRLETVDGGIWEPLLETVLRFHEARRNELGQTLRAFHLDVAAGFHARGGLALYVLYLSSSPIAALYGFREMNTLYCYMQGFDPAWAKLSPGVMVMGGAIEDAIGQGVRRIDFLRGQEPYKTWWGTRNRETYRRTLNPPRINLPRNNRGPDA